MKKILTLTSAVMLLVACSKSETNIVEPQDNVRQIKAQSAIEGVTSRAVIATDAALSDIVFVRYDDSAQTWRATSTFRQRRPFPAVVPWEERSLSPPDSSTTWSTTRLPISGGTIRRVRSLPGLRHGLPTGLPIS